MPCMMGNPRGSWRELKIYFVLRIIFGRRQEVAFPAI
jgi:hypothetical protein